MYYQMLSALSTHGFVIIAPTAGHNGLLSCDTIWCEEEHIDMHTALRIAHERRAEPPFTSIDWSAGAGLFGHSMGGLATLIAATLPPPAGIKISAAVAFSASGLARPVGHVDGSGDAIDWWVHAMRKWERGARMRPGFAAIYADTLPKNFTASTRVPVMYVVGTRELNASSQDARDHPATQLYAEGALGRAAKPNGVDDLFVVLEGYHHDDPAQVLYVLLPCRPVQTLPRDCSPFLMSTAVARIACSLSPLAVSQPTF